MAHTSIKFCERQLAKHWHLIYRMANHKFADTDAAEEAVSYVTEHLTKDNWYRLRMYRPIAEFKTYLIAVVSNLLIDFARQKYGRKKIPQWIKKRGVLWAKIYKLLCIEGLSNTDVTRWMIQEKKNQSIVEDIIQLIRENIPDCGKPLRPVRVEIDAEAVYPVSENPEKLLIDKERKAQLAALNLNSQERILLRLIYTEGFSISKAGRMLGLNPDQVHGKHRRLLARIKKELESVNGF